MPILTILKLAGAFFSKNGKLVLLTALIALAAYQVKLYGDRRFKAGEDKAFSDVSREIAKADQHNREIEKHNQATVNEIGSKAATDQDQRNRHEVEIEHKIERELPADVPACAVPDVTVADLNAIRAGAGL